MAVDGKTSRGARRADGTRVHLLGVAEHGGRLLDHLEVDVKHNETSHFTGLLQPLDLAGTVVTFDALHTVRANLNWLAREKKGRYIAVVKANQPRPVSPGSRHCPGGRSRPAALTRDAGHGRIETRSLKTAHVSSLGFPGRPPGHQDHPLAAGHGHREDLPPDRLRHHQPDQRTGHRGRTWPASCASTGLSRHIITSAT